MWRKTTNSWLKHWDFILLDLLAIQAAFVLSFMIRNSGNPYKNPLYLNLSVILCLADICTAFFMEGYKGILRRNLSQELQAVTKHMFFITIIEMLYLFMLQKSATYSRAVFVYFAFLSVCIVFCVRSIWKYILLKHKILFYDKHVVLIMTTSAHAKDVIGTMQHHTYNELQIAGIIYLDRDDMVGTYEMGIPVVCTKQEALDYIKTRWVDSVMIHTKREELLPENLISGCLEMGVVVHRGLAAIGEDNSNQQLNRFGGYLVLSYILCKASAGQLFFKRAMDILGALVGLVLTGIMTIVLAPAIYLVSPGPVFFSQIRVGRSGRKFRIYKFRSMYIDAEQRKQELMADNEMQGQLFKMEHDPRIIGSGPDGTRHGLGWFIRKTSMDEFPQFLNVLKGEMSLVGTRPPTVDEWNNYEYHHRARLTMKPGLTGMWQISGRNNITDFESVVRLDMEYIQNWSLWLDFKILIKTVYVVLLGIGSK